MGESGRGGADAASLASFARALACSLALGSADTGTMESHLSLSAGKTRASHNLGFSPRARRRLTRPDGVGTITPASMASSMRCLKRRRRIKERRMIAEETNNNRNRVARKVNKYKEEEGPPPVPLLFCGGLLPGSLGDELDGSAEEVVVVEDMEGAGRDNRWPVDQSKDI